MPLKENSIRIRMIALVVITLGISLGAYLHIGTRLVTRFESNERKRSLSDELQIATERVQHDLERSFDFIRSAGNLIDGVPQEDMNDWFEGRFAFASSRLNWKGWVLLTPSMNAGPDAPAIERAIERLGWNSPKSRWKEERIRLLRPGRLLIAEAVPDRQGKLRIFAVSITIESRAPDPARQRPALLLSVREDDQPTTLYFHAGETGFSSANAEEFAGNLSRPASISSPTRTDVVFRELNSNGRDYLAAYRWLWNGQILVSAIQPVVSEQPLGAAFVRRTLAVAGSVLILIIGLSLIFIEGALRSKSRRPTALGG